VPLGGVGGDISGRDEGWLQRGVQRLILPGLPGPIEDERGGFGGDGVGFVAPGSLSFHTFQAAPPRLPKFLMDSLHFNEVGLVQGPEDGDSGAEEVFEVREGLEVGGAEEEVMGGLFEAEHELELEADLDALDVDG